MAKVAPSKITYVTLFADERIHPKYEVALERFEGELGRRYPMFIGEEEVWSEGDIKKTTANIAKNTIAPCFRVFGLGWFSSSFGFRACYFVVLSIP